MNIDDLAALIADHGEFYDAEGFYGCDCGFACGSREHSHHVAALLVGSHFRSAARLEVRTHDEA